LRTPSPVEVVWMLQYPDVMKILAATDFSPEAHLAVQQAAQLAARTGSDLVLVHVEPPAKWLPRGAMSDDTADQAHAMVESERQATIARLEALADELRDDVPSVHYAATTGYPDEAICESARELHADLIVTGTHGRTGLRRMWVGSVAERVTRQSSEPVLVVRKKLAEHGFRRILVATDLSEESERALKWAAALAHTDSAIDLFYASHPSFGGHDYFASGSAEVGALYDEIEQRAMSTARQWMEKYGRKGIDFRFELGRGVAAEMIVERMEDRHYDLVALGSHGHRGFRRMMVGSVAEHVLRHAPCSVLIAHAGTPRT